MRTIAIVVLAVLAFPLAPSASEELEWQVREFSFEENEFFSQTYFILGCRISLHRDAPGLVVDVFEERQYGLADTLHQTIQIYYDASEDQVVMKRDTVGMRGDVFIALRSPHDGGPVLLDIFTTTCREHIPTLPPEVRKEFYGYYDIQ